MLMFEQLNQKRQKSPNQETGLGNREPLDSKSILKELGPIWYQTAYSKLALECP